MKTIIVFLLFALACAPSAFAQAGSVVFTEVLYDDTSFSDVEWLEIHNTTAAAIDISNWIIHDDNSYPPDAEGAWRIPEGTSIGVDQYLVLSRLELPEITGEVICTQYFGALVMGNSGDNLALYTAETGGTLVDGSLTSNYPDQAGNESGNSIEKCNPFSGWSSAGSAWHVSLNVFATSGRYRNCTPGFANTPCPDTTPPDIDSVRVNSATSLDVYFNEIVQQASAETESNYSINNGIGNPTLAVRDGTNLRLVHLTTSSLPNNNYVLTTTVSDMSGNSTVRTESFTVSFGVTPGIVVISEIMYDDTGVTDIEWVEVRNRTGATVDISNWVLIDASTYPPGASEGGWQIPASTTVAAGGYKVLSAVDLPGITGEVVCSHYDLTFDLHDVGDNLALYSAPTGGTLVDGALSGVYPDLSPANSGYSIEKCHPDSLWSTDPAAWHISATTFGSGRYRRCTPGAANSICTGDVTPPVISTITVLYNTVLDVTFSEVVELNTSQTAANYAVNGGVGSPATAVRQADQRIVRLTFPVGITPNTYLLTVSNVEDQAANPVEPGTAALFTIASVPSMKFTEVMPDPNFAGAADSSGEWFEIYNLSGAAVSLTNWKITDAAGSDTIEGAVSVGIGEYFVFAARGDSASNGGIPEHYDYKWGSSGWGLSLDNTGELLRLLNDQGSLVCQLEYTGQPFTTGRSAQLRDLSYDPAIDSNWCQAVAIWSGAWNGDRGTPRAAAICPDITPPAIISATPVSGTQVNVLFNEPVGLPSSEVLANYNVNNGVGNPLTAIRAMNPALVMLSFNPLAPNTYILTVNNVADTSGNTAMGLTANFTISSSAGNIALIMPSNTDNPLYAWDAASVICPDSVRQVFFLKNFGTGPASVTPPLQVGGPHFYLTTNCSSPFDLTAGQISACSLTIVFRPQAVDIFIDTLRFISDAANAQGGYVRIPLYGEQTAEPQPPQQLVTRRSGNNVVLNWRRVSQSTQGCPLSIDIYELYVAQDPNGPYGFLGATTDSVYTHINAVNLQSKQFYEVIAIDN